MDNYNIYIQEEIIILSCKLQIGFFFLHASDPCVQVIFLWNMSTCKRELCQHTTQLCWHAKKLHLNQNYSKSDFSKKKKTLWWHYGGTCPLCAGYFSIKYINMLASKIVMSTCKISMLTYARKLQFGQNDSKSDICKNYGWHAR